MNIRQKLRVWLIALVTGLVVLAAGVAAAGCGGGQQTDELVAIPATTTTTTSGETTAGDTGGATTVFAEVAEAVPSMPIYGTAMLPAGVTVAVGWWPVLESEGPETYQGPAAGNPRIVGGDDAGDAEVQVVLQAGEGWLVVLEDFRGDLGDVTGKYVGDVDGHTATLYEVNGGRLVQWSDSGRWYGVFGRGVAEDMVVTLALSMRLMIPAENR
jgi:hypothetical protein